MESAYPRLTAEVLSPVFSLLSLSITQFTQSSFLHISESHVLYLVCICGKLSRSQSGDRSVMQLSEHQEAKHGPSLQCNTTIM